MAQKLEMITKQFGELIDRSEESSTVQPVQKIIQLTVYQRPTSLETPFLRKDFTSFRVPLKP